MTPFAALTTRKVRPFLLKNGAGNCMPLKRNLLATPFLMPKIDDSPMSTEVQPPSERQLSKNEVKFFILKINFTDEDASRCAAVVGGLAPTFDRVERKTTQGVKVDLSSGAPAITPDQKTEVILTSTEQALTLAFVEAEPSIAFSTNRYRNYKTYTDAFVRFQEAFTAVAPNQRSRRIGMRFINEFRCPKRNDVRKVLRGRQSTAVLNTLSDDNVSRAIAMVEYNWDSIKARVQYGVPNKYYPAVLGVYDLLLDIDVYTDEPVEVSKWSELASTLNHRAYDLFLSHIHPDFIGKLR